MTTESRHLAEPIARPAGAVYDYASDPANLPAWAPGLGTAVTKVDGRWYVDTSDGRAGMTFAPRNDLGVLDHDVTLPSGLTVHNAIRVVPDGDDDCEVVFTLRRQPGMTDDDFDRDAGLVAADLARLRTILER